MISSRGARIDLATIPPLRGPKRHNSAQKRKSGRSSRDDSGEMSGRPLSYGGQAEDGQHNGKRTLGTDLKAAHYTDRRKPRA